MSDFNKPPAPDEPTGASAYGSPPPPPGAYGTPPPTPPAYGTPTAGAPVTEADERLWGMLGHLGGILISWISGLIVYLVYKDRSQYLKEQGAEALNFQITLAIAEIIGWITSWLGIGLILVGVVYVVRVVFGIIAGVAANKHENYRYPFAIRLIK